MPITTLAGRLSANRLHLVVFGPGYGESVAVHVPDGGWLICDSLSKPHGSVDFIPAAELLTSRQERAAVLILTHPHNDHVGGFDRLVARFAVGRVGLVGLHLPEPGFTEHDDAAEVVKTSNRVKALAAIAADWQRHPEHKWEMTADDGALQFGSGTIEILHPDNEYLRLRKPDPSAAPNAYSTPVLVSWDQVRIVLGADLPTAQWGSVLDRPRETELSDHGALKVSHHGSTEALPDELVRSGDRDSLAVLTPWHLGGRILPKLGPEGGVSWLLARRSAVSLTSPGRAIRDDLPRQLPLAQFADAVTRRPLPGGVASVEITRSYEPDESWVAATFNRRGELEAVEFGEDARVIVSRETVSETGLYPTR